MAPPAVQMVKLPPSPIVSRNDELNLYLVNPPPLLAHQIYPSVNPAAGAACQINLVLRNNAKGFARINHSSARVSPCLKVNLVRLPTLTLRLPPPPLALVPPTTTCTLEDNKEIRGASVDAKGSAVAQEYSLLDPHSRSYQSQSVSPNGEAPKVEQTEEGWGWANRGLKEHQQFSR